MAETNRTYVELSDEKRAQIKLWQAQVKEELPDLAKRLQLANEAAQENTFSGELRRAIHTSGFTVMHIAEHVGTTPLVIDEFLTGERTLRSDILDRLVDFLGCKMIQQNSNKTTTKGKFPLEEAYAFAHEYGGELWRQVQREQSKRNDIKKNRPNQASSVLRGAIIRLFERHGVLEQFVQSIWKRSLQDQNRELARCRNLLARYEKEFGPVA